MKAKAGALVAEFISLQKMQIFGLVLYGISPTSKNVRCIHSATIWRFMGSYKWDYNSPNKGNVTLFITPLITTHEPPSKGKFWR